MISPADASEAMLWPGAIEAILWPAVTVTAGIS